MIHEKYRNLLIRVGALPDVQDLVRQTFLEAIMISGEINLICRSVEAGRRARAGREKVEVTKAQVLADAIKELQNIGELDIEELLALLE